MAQESEVKSDVAAGARRHGTGATRVIDLEATEIAAESAHAGRSPASETAAERNPTHPADPDTAPPPRVSARAGRGSGGERTSFLSLRRLSFGLGLVVLLLAVAVSDAWLHRVQRLSFVTQQNLATQLAGVTQRLSALDAASAAAASAAAELRRSVDAVKRQSDALQARLDDSAGRIADVQKTLSAIERTPAESGSRIGAADTAAREALQAVAELRAALAAAGPRSEAGDALASVQAQVSALDRKLGETAAELAALRAGAPSAAAARPAQDDLAAVLAQLTAKAASSAPFGAELARIEALAPASPGLDALKAHAAGVPSAADLRRRLAELPAAAPPAPEPVPERAAGLWPGFKAWFAGFVKVRRVVAPDWRAELAGIEEAAARGDLAQAAALAEAAKAAPRELASWIEAARARLAVDRALAQLAAHRTPQG